MNYTYRNYRGQRRTVRAPMSLPPPDRIVFKNDGNWMPASQVKPQHRRRTVWRRVYSPVLFHTRWQPDNAPRDLKFKPGAV